MTQLMCVHMCVCVRTDKQYILKKCPYLLNEMISTAHQLFFYDQAGRGTVTLVCQLIAFLLINIIHC